MGCSNIFAQFLCKRIGSTAEEYSMLSRIDGLRDDIDVRMEERWHQARAVFYLNGHRTSAKLVPTRKCMSRNPSDQAHAPDQ